MSDEAVHSYFGLSYANYLVLHRTLMQSMPPEWQRRMVACLEELDEAFAHVEKPSTFMVEAAREVDYADLRGPDLERLGVTTSDDGDEDDDLEKPLVFYDRDGTEHDPFDRVLVPLPGGDPVPHYNRGRTRIQPRIGG